MRSRSCAFLSATIKYTCQAAVKSDASRRWGIDFSGVIARGEFVRVFKHYWLAIKNKEIAVKDILGVADSFLVENGFTYERLFSPSEPGLSPEDIRELFRKIPRPCNPGYLEVWFDGIDWFHMPPPKGCFRKNVAGSFLLSNSIRIIRFAGNTFYHVEFFLELTDPEQKEGIRSESKLTDLIRQRFGKLKEEPLECVFTSEEQEAIEAKRLLIEGDISKISGSLTQFHMDPKDMMRSLSNKINKAAEATTVKKPLMKCFPKPEYSYTYDGEFIVKKRTAHGFELGVSFDSPPHHMQVNGAIWIRGVNFRYSFAQGQMVRDTQENVERFVEAYRHMADIIENSLDARLYDTFGETPAWYFR